MIASARLPYFVEQIVGRRGCHYPREGLEAMSGKALIKVGTRNTSSFPSPEQQSEKNENDRKVWLPVEIISCRRNLELELPREEETVLVYWAYDCYKQGRVDALVGNDEEAMTDLDGVLRLLMVAIWCIQEDPSRRPTMKSVWQMLDCAIVVPAPPDPSLIN
ncbi:hypothetical protein J5N97_022790 [Dioscorea zingiberensis]|uniref:Uncharacterized protein n=1 Tax=Dioscorea zingiberensis TaxID=325984 RepID=A0A9D5CB23_9LILI|nr:hypothetical protein J5N97_022790 [Dioscorea zingiberensis]